MSSYPEPRTVLISWSDLQSLTVLEQARACVLAGIKPAEASALMRDYATGDGSPEDLLRGALLFYAVAYELELRRDPELSWSAAQGWRVQLDATRDPLIAAEAEAKVRTALATNLPPEVAGDLSMAEVEAYNAVRAEAERAARRPRRRAPRR